MGLAAALRRLLLLGRSHGGAVPGAVLLDSTRDRGAVVTATNATGFDQHDAIFTMTAPAGLDATGFRLRELTARETTGTTVAGVENAQSWRYGAANTSSPNQWLGVLPAYASGSTVYGKAPGKWTAGETRWFLLSWNAAGGSAAYEYTHLDSVATTWTATAVAGTGGDGVTTGDVYPLAVGPVGSQTTYSYRMVTGDTATVIATAIKNLINGGAVATATNVAGVLTITPVNARSMTFQVLTGGTVTTPANLVVSATATPRLKIARTGPDTASYAVATYGTGLPLGLGASVVATRVGFGRADTNVLVMGDYRESANVSAGAIYGPNAAGQYTTPLTQTRNGPTVDYTGRVVYSQRAAGDDWLTTYTVQHRHVLFLGRKSDDTGAGTLLKFCDVFRIVLTQTAQRAYTPFAVANNVTSANSVLKICGIDTTGAVFTSNVTEAAGNQLPGFYFRPGTDSVPQVFAAAADLSALPVTGTIFGMHGNTLGTGMLINSVTVTGMGSQAPEAKIAAGSARASSQLQFRNLSNATPIPQGAQIVTDLWFVQGFTNNATTVGDNLLPDELVTLLRGLSATPIVGSTGRVGAYSASNLNNAMLVASAGGVQALQYFADNAVAVTTVTRGYAYNKHVRTGTISNPDDDDGSYGVAYGLLGLVLRYRRTHDAALIALLENYVQYFVDIEAAAVAKYGSFWSGLMPYWYYWSTGTTLYNSDGGIQEASGATGVDPGVATFSVASVTITNAGTGYTSTPTCTFSAPAAGGTTATGTVVRSGTTVGSITITNPGNGYTGLPTVSFSGGGGANAAGTVVTQVGLGPITYGAGSYLQGSPRRKTSIDQMQTAAFGLWSYLALLAAEPAITANTTLRTNALGLLSRMATAEATYYSASAQIIANAYRICAGLDAQNSNGIDDANLNTAVPTTINNPFWGNVYNAWEVLNGSGQQNTASANTTMLAFFRALFAPDSVESGVVRWITGQANDMVGTDLSRHDVVFGAGMATLGVSGLYPAGWSCRPAVPSNTTVYESPRTTTGNGVAPTDLHYLSINGTARDHLSGRSAQRAIVLALALMLQNAYAVAVENSGTSVTRSVAISTALDDTVRAVLRYGIEPTTKANRLAASGWLSKSTSYDPQIVESPYTGYWMAAVEMWLLAQDVVSGSRKLKDYFRFEGDSLAEWERTTVAGPYVDSNRLTTAGSDTVTPMATAVGTDHGNAIFLGNHSLRSHEVTPHQFLPAIQAAAPTVKLISQDTGKWSATDPPDSWTNGFYTQTLAALAAVNADTWTAQQRAFWGTVAHHLGYVVVDDGTDSASAGSENLRQTIQKAAYLIASLRALDTRKFASATAATIAALGLLSSDNPGLGVTYKYPFGARQASGGYLTGGPYEWTPKGQFRSSRNSVSSSHDYLDELAAWRAQWPAAMRLLTPMQVHCTSNDGSGAQNATPTSSTQLRYPYTEEIPLYAWMAVARGVSGFLWFTWNDEVTGGGGWFGYGNAAQATLRTAIAAINLRLLTEPIGGIIRRLQWDPNDQPFTLTGGGEATNAYTAGFVSALKDPWTQTYYVVAGNYGLVGQNVQVLSGSLVGTLKGMESGSTYALGADIALGALDGTLLRFVPTSVAAGALDFSQVSQSGLVAVAL